MIQQYVKIEVAKEEELNTHSLAMKGVMCVY